MGATSSSARILPADVTAFSAAEVAAQVRALGKPYEGYADKIEENGLDGSFLEELTSDDLPGIFADIGVVSTMHQKKLSAVFRSLKALAGGEISAANTGPANAPEEPSTSTPAGHLVGASPTEPEKPQQHDIFLSLRFGEAMAEAKALRQALALSGESAFICEVSAGADIKTVVIEKLVQARLVVVFGSATYGTGTVNFSTKEEMEFFLSEKIPFVLVKMCDVFEEPRTRFNFGPSVSYIEWLPGATMPNDLVPTVLAALGQARNGTDSPPKQIVAAYTPSPIDAQGSKKFAGFLSHFKYECGTEARLVQLQLKPILQRAPISTASSDIFLDSDDLSDLRNLLNHVKETQVLVLLQSKGVLTRPWVILELYTAITSGVPIVALNVQNSYPYDYAAALEFLLHFDAEIELANPGAAQLLTDMNVDPVDCAYLLSDSLPNIISTSFNPNGSERQIQASLEDLADAMRKAKPIAPSMSKEEWLTMRAAPKSNQNTVSKKEHGARDSDQALDAKPLIMRALSDVPSSVPELPNAYLVRDEDLSQLKAALLAEDGTNGTATTSKTSGGKQKKLQNKVGAHGMGGVGKTTIAAALVHDEEIRSSFEKILWVSVGQEPDIRELQDSLFFQITGHHFSDDVKKADEALKAVRDAAKSCNVLLVLDDVWNPVHEKPLNCIDSDTKSRLLVTTRVRGLLKNAAEVNVGVLSAAEALELLLASAEVDEEDVEEGSDDGHRIATEIVELCGRLPLTLAIAGGMVADNGQVFTEDILEVMKDKQELEDEEGVTVESRVISSSVSMMVKGAGKHKELVAKVFRFFACFPEDVPVPAPFFNKMAPLLSDDKNEKKARLAVGSSLSTLLKYNLVKGSLSAGSGVFMHDVVRDYVIHQHSEEELRLLQRSVVDMVLASRPEPGGFPTSQYTTLGTFEGYISRQLFWHFRGALEIETDEEPPDQWMAHSDNGIRANVAMAVGLEALDALSEAREAAGDLVRAAQVSWTAGMTKGIDNSIYFDRLYRTCDLLERADDMAVVDFETSVLGVATLNHDGTLSERHSRAIERIKALRSKSEETYDMLRAEIGSLNYTICEKMGLWAGGKDTIEAMMEPIPETHRLFIKAGKLAKNDSLKVYDTKLAPSNLYAYTIVGSHLDVWNPDSEANIIEAVNFYRYEVCGAALRAVGSGNDWFRTGQFINILGLVYGNFDVINIWYRKTIAAFEHIDLPSTRNYKDELNQVHQLTDMSGVHLLIIVGQEEKAAGLLNAFGFTCDELGLERYRQFHRIKDPDMKGYADNFTMHRITKFLSFPLASTDLEEMNAFMPSPQELAALERDNSMLSRFGVCDATSFGARAFLKLGRDDDAYELAKNAVSPEQQTLKWTTRVTCHSILGQVAAKRGDLEEADGHFAKALEEARTSQLPMLELLAARDWKQHLLEPEGRECGAAEAVIDGACSKMNKTREQARPVLWTPPMVCRS